MVMDEDDDFLYGRDEEEVEVIEYLRDLGYEDDEIVELRISEADLD